MDLLSSAISGVPLSEALGGHCLVLLLLGTLSLAGSKSWFPAWQFSMLRIRPHTPAPSHPSLVDCLLTLHPSLIDCLLSSHLSLFDCLLTPHPSLIDCLLSSHLSLVDCLLTPSSLLSSFSCLSLRLAFFPLIYLMLDVRPLTVHSLDSQFRKLATRGWDGGTTHSHQPGHETSENLGLTADLCLLLKCHSKVCVFPWACWCPLLLTHWEGLGVLIPSQLSSIVISLGTDTCYVLTTGARIFNVPRIHVSVARGLHLEHESELLVGVTLLSLLPLSSCLTWNLFL